MAEDEGLPHYEVPVGLFQDLEDLKVTVAWLSAQVNTLREDTDEPEAEASEDDEAAAVGEGEGGEEEDRAQYPPFILLLDSPQYDDELRALIEWVEGVLVPGYLAEPSADARWCHLWIEHPVAVARLHALWLAWQELTDPATCGYTGPSVWHRDHLDPCIRELRPSTGPFAGCTKGEHQIAHRQPGRVPSAWNRGED
ncbi:DUF4913 domain-containing protein [Streptomyces sp. NPDC056773]|uniref:DUF4913 domain-containing protein n=1 Tax=unclassified Streptomyces TaxID=2593676 RepID=UPI00367AFAA9